MPTYSSAGPNAEGQYRCCMCREWKEPDAFPLNRSTKRGLSARCRSCHAIYVRRPEVRAKNREYAAKRYAVAREIVRDEKSKPCMDCGRTFPSYCMEFDHPQRRGDRYTVAHAAGGSLATLQAEIEVTELVCACCHRIRTRERDGIVPFGGKLSKGRPRKADGEW